MAERCILHGILVASFFFFRTDNSRNTLDPLVATLAYQIIQLLPDTKKHIVEAIESNPLVFCQTFEAQLDLLVIRPLLLLRSSDPTWMLVFIVDGVDECKDEDMQMNLIRTFAKFLRSKNLPLIILFSSRRENQILMAFNSRDMHGILTRLPLDDNYQPEKDILRFLNDSFEEIKQTHPYGEGLGAEWPSPNHVQEIVSKSSGQFIYASVVINFVSDPSANPSVRLDIIHGLHPAGRLTPFAQLDTLYHFIFSQVDDIQATLEFLAYMIFAKYSTLEETMYVLEYSSADVQSVMAHLAPVLLINPEENEITFCHASLPDFLRDKARSRQFCINALAAPLCVRWFKAAESGRFKNLPCG